MSNIYIANMQLCSSLNMCDTMCINYCWLHIAIHS